MAGQAREGTVYTETVIYSPPEQYASDAPYQIAIVDMDGGARQTVRIAAREPNERVHIGDRVTYLEDRNGVPYYRNSSAGVNEMPAPLV